MPQPGDDAPDFSLPDAQGRVRRLSDFRGRRVVLSFYPPGGTPDCALQAGGFRDHFATYTEEGIEILGVSPDPPESREAFAAEHNLPFFLLSDGDAAVSRAYGVCAEGGGGKKPRRVRRTTFVIGPDGRIERVFRDVRPETHALDVLRGAASGAASPGG